MNKVKVCNSAPFHTGSQKSLKAFAINCKLGRVLLATQVLGKLLGRKVVKKLIFLYSSSTCLIFSGFTVATVVWGRAQDSNGGSHKMLSLYGTLEPLRLLLRVSTYCSTTDSTLQQSCFQSIVPKSIASNGNKKRTSRPSLLTCIIIVWLREGFLAI